jgi:hypothetical protein
MYHFTSAHTKQKCLNAHDSRSAREANHSPSSSVEVKKLELYLYSPLRLHGMLLNYISTGIILPVPLHNSHINKTYKNHVVVKVRTYALLGLT